jgi:cobalt/nickel transport system ATP-binding protein
MSVLTVDHLSHSFADGRRALDDLSFAIGANESVAIVGANGAGKTTLILRLCGVLGGKPGQIRVGELDPARSADRQQLPTRIGVVFQNPDDQLFSSSIADDVAFGALNLGLSLDECRERTASALAAVGLPDHGSRVPHLLSGGEKRRAAIATVLTMRPSILLLDEPTMFLDPRGRRELIRLIAELPGTKLIATHDLELVLDLCPRVLLLADGKLMVDGRSDEVLANAELIEPHGLEVPYRLRRDVIEPK